MDELKCLLHSEFAFLSKDGEDGEYVPGDAIT